MSWSESPKMHTNTSGQGALRKRCSRCGETKAHSAFYRDATNDDGLGFYCRMCKNGMRADYYAKNRKAICARQKAYAEKNERKLRDTVLQRTYGMTMDEYDEMLAAQGGGCAICGGQCPTGRRLAVDHDHETGENRGLLCSKCNGGFGYFSEDPGRLMAAIEYAWTTGDRVWIS